MKIMTQIFQNEEWKKYTVHQTNPILENSCVLGVSEKSLCLNFKMFFLFCYVYKKFRRSTLAEDNFLYNLKLVRCLICP